MRTWSNWTTSEIRKLKEAHKNRVPSLSELSVILPRHTTDGIRQRAVLHNLRPRERDWFKIAQQYSAERGDRSLVRI